MGLNNKVRTLYQATVAASSSNVQAPNVPKPVDYSLGPGSVLFCVYQGPMIQAHIDQLHEAVGSIPIRLVQPAIMEVVVVTEMAVHLVGYGDTDGNAGGLGRAPAPAAAGGPSPPDPPDDDDDGDEDGEEEPSDDDDDDDRRRNRRSSRRRRSGSQRS